MNEEYTKYFEKFHKERLSYLSGKDKYKKCKGCETDKNFTEEDNELIYSCGSTDHGEDCGDQFKIKLPESAFTKFGFSCKLFNPLYSFFVIE